MKRAGLLYSVKRTRLNATLVRTAEATLWATFYANI